MQLFDFSGTIPAGATIDSFELTLNYQGISGSENWFVRVMGSDDSMLDDDIITGPLATGSNSTTFTFTAADDGGLVDAFSSSVGSELFRLRFREESSGDDNFLLDNVQLVVNGTPAPIPLPASGLLLLGALGGAAMIRRRRKAD